jgi:predicted permease
MQSLIRNVHYALRQLRRSPGFTFTVVMTLALGVGANTVVFGVINALILRPLALPDAERLVFFNNLDAKTGDEGPMNSYPDYRDLRDHNHTFVGVASFEMALAGVGEAESGAGGAAGNAGAVRPSWLYEASENYFDLIGIHPLLGRFFNASEAHGPNSMPFAVLSFAYWQTRCNADPGIVGKHIEINKHPMTVVGVTPRGFVGTDLMGSPDMWVPVLNKEQIDGVSDLEARGVDQTWVFGRLKPGVRWAEAEADLNTVARGMAHQYKEDDAFAIRLSTMGFGGDFLGRPVRAFLSGVMALALLVLLAACANLGALFAARASDRSREFAVRLALGAGRGTLVRQLLTESILISLLGGAVGLAAAVGVLRAISLWRPLPSYPLQLSVYADNRVGAAALLLAVASGIFFGLVPVRQVWRGNAYMIIKSGSGSGEVATSRRWWTRFTLRDMLLVVQIVLCSVLVTSALVAVRGLTRSLSSAYGFHPEGVLLANFDLRMAGMNQEQALRFQHRAVDRLAALPGVSAVAFANSTPLNLNTRNDYVFRDGTSDFRSTNAAASAFYYDVSPGYFAAARTRLLAGREFRWQDDEHAPLVAIVNPGLARRVFGVKPGLEQQAVGRYFTTGAKNRYQVVGLVEQGKYFTLTEDPQEAMFFPAGQAKSTATTMIVRSLDSRPTGGSTTAAAISQALLAMEPSLPLELTSWQQSLGMVLFPSVVATASLGLMGGLAAMLAVTGIFGMASYSVSKRLRELGIRVALGAQRREVLAAALGKPARLLLIGSVVGLSLGALASRLLAHIVYQATSQDPVVLLGVVASMMLLALVATWLPARRALHVDPARLLRDE